MSVDTARYLNMERAFYADLVARSNFASEAFTRVDTGEFVVGSYVQHETLEYERLLLGGVCTGSDAVALEYGCGPGRMLLRFAPRFNRVDGVDISDEVIEVARRRCADLPSPPRLFLTDGQNLPAELDGRYDVAFSVICLQHICVYTVRRQILRGLFRALKPGGLLTFQMGYGPGHAHMIDYFADFVDAPGTNGVADVGVLHPAEIAGDLMGVGFTRAAYTLTPTGPGDTHAAWIFVRAIKPGPGSTASLKTDPDAWSAQGFLPLVCDENAAARARRLHQEHGLIAQFRGVAEETAALKAAVTSVEEQAREQTSRLQEQAGLQALSLEEQARQHAATLEERARQEVLRLEEHARHRIEGLEECLAVKDATIVGLESERANLEDSLAMARADRDGWRDRAAEANRDREQLRRQVDVQGRQLARLRVADRRRVSAVIAELAHTAAADRLRVGVLGAGEHTEWLLRETPLDTIADLFFFDSDPSRAGTTIAGHPVLAAREIPAKHLHAIVVSSLAFHEEMVSFLDALPMPGPRIVRCYP